MAVSSRDFQAALQRVPPSLSRGMQLVSEIGGSSNPDTRSLACMQIYACRQILHSGELWALAVMSNNIGAYHTCSGQPHAETVDIRHLQSLRGEWIIKHVGKPFTKEVGSGLVQSHGAMLVDTRT